MKRFIQILFFLILISFGFGFYFKNTQNTQLGDVIIGITIITTAFILMPLFIYRQSKGKKLNDYMLTKENIEKMRDKKGENPENQ
ncbi:hypothetical protein GTQ40_12525 [Flavobacteriaceae bacterium R38]|nr:hypothetical protein [Flavobacteriaceae bacterium R38]